MWYFLGAWIGMNLLTFLVWGRDKQKAISGWWRMSEKTLLLLSICGGWLGAILAIDYFRHKTIKSRFVWKLYAIGLLWIVGIMVVMMIRF